MDKELNLAKLIDDAADCIRDLKKANLNLDDIQEEYFRGEPKTDKDVQYMVFNYDRADMRIEIVSLFIRQVHEKLDNIVNYIEKFRQIS